MHEMFIDPFAAHVYQAILHTLTGHPQKNLVEEHTAKKRKVEAEANTLYETPPSFGELRKKFLSLVKQWDLPLLQSQVFDKYAVPLLQSIIEIDIPKKSKKRAKEGTTGPQTLADLVLFGTDPDPKGISRGLSLNNQNSRISGIV
jgi:hypothetical protein